MAKSKQRNRKDNMKGGADKSRFARLDHRIIESAAYSALTPNSRSLLIELTAMENGSNNGLLWLSVRDAAARMGVTDTKAAQAAFEQLQALGFIAMTREAHFVVKVAEASRARCWRLTWQAVEGQRGPSHEYLTLEPDAGSRDRKRMECRQRALKKWKRDMAEKKLPVVDSTTTGLETRLGLPITVVESPTCFEAIGENAPKLVVVDSTTHTAGTMGYGGSVVQRPTCWASGRVNSLERLLAAFAAQARPELAVAA